MNSIKSLSAKFYPNDIESYIVNDVDKARSIGLDVLEVEEAEYAVVELIGSVPDCIHNGWKYALEVFFPEHGCLLNNDE